jgi:hypothetical protein
MALEQRAVEQIPDAAQVRPVALLGAAQAAPGLARPVRVLLAVALLQVRAEAATVQLPALAPRSAHAAAIHRFRRHGRPVCSRAVG